MTEQDKLNTNIEATHEVGLLRQGNESHDQPITDIDKKQRALDKALLELRFLYRHLHRVSYSIGLLLQDIDAEHPMKVED